MELNMGHIIVKIAAGLALALMSCACSMYGSDNIPPLLPMPLEAEFGNGYFRPEGNGSCFESADVRISESFAEELGAEGYIIRVGRKKIKIRAASETGVFYARQTLSQIAGKDGIRICRIKDWPRFPYRGIHLDVSRNFFPKEQVFKILDEMARYKLNNFHFHLTDNGGWRIQIDKYPLLTELGSHRTDGDWFRWYCVSRKFCTADTPGAVGGFYTKDDIREIVAYASRLHINVIPEIDMPAHSDPVFAGYPHLNCTNATSGNGEFCPAKEETYVFIENVLDEILELFPSEVIHIGGDEARKKEWEKCPQCSALMEKEGIPDYDRLQVHFIRKIGEYLREKGRIMAGWDEILKDPGLPEDAVVYGYRGEKYAIEAANRGFRTVMVPGEVLYMDWWQSDIYREPYAMGGYSPLYKVYMFNPLPSDKEEVAANEIMISSSRADADSVGFIRQENLENVIGVQGCLWTEFIGTADHLEYMMFPRFLAVAEKGWSSEDSRDWENFKTRLSAQRDSLVARGINAYDLHDAPIITAEAVSPTESEMTMICEQVGAEIRYCIGEDGVVDRNSELYTGPVRICSDVTVKAGVFADGKLISYIRGCKITAGKDTDAEYPTRWPW